MMIKTSHAFSCTPTNVFEEIFDQCVTENGHLHCIDQHDCGYSGILEETCEKQTFNGTPCCYNGTVSTPNNPRPICYHSFQTQAPTRNPTSTPTTQTPTLTPTNTPTSSPSASPTYSPTQFPTTFEPTSFPTSSPTDECGMKQYEFNLLCTRDVESGLFLDGTTCEPLLNELFQLCGPCPI